MKKTRQNGIALVEVIVSVAIVTAALFGVLTTAKQSIEISRRSLHVSQAGLLLEEGSEAVRSIRDTDWLLIQNVSSGIDYYLDFIGSSYVLTTTPQTTDIFTRKVIFEDVLRDGNDDISSTGSVDTGTRKVSITVSWNEVDTLEERSIGFFIADIFKQQI